MMRTVARSLPAGRAWRLLLLAALVLSLPAAARAAVERVVVRVPSSARAQLTAAEVRLENRLDYGAFDWVELAEGDLAQLAKKGIPYEVVTDARQVRVPGYRFDPIKDGEPEIAPERRADASSPGFRLVQLQGPAKDEWLTRLGASGARVLQYYPHNTYLVWSAPAAGEAIDALDFVRWQGLFHPAYKVNSDLQGRTGRIENVDVMFYSDDVKQTLGTFRVFGATVVQSNPSQADGAFYSAILKLDSAAIDAVASVPEVLWLGYESTRATLDDEMSDQIMAGNHPGGTPVIGYNAHLGTLGVNGTGVIWAIIDTGADYDHPDLASHIVGGYSFPGIPVGCDTGSQPGTDCNNGGHGTHVAGIVGGNATGASTDVNGFLYGLGMAPAYSIFAMNSLSAPAWPPVGGWQEHTKRAVLGNAIGGNNSWTTGEGAAHGYQASERTHDLMVRDGNFDTASVAEPFIEVFSAGNSGPGAMTLTAPHEGKNLIVTAASQNFRVGNINNIASFSSRGPAVDGRIVPTITSPGEQIASSRNDSGGVCNTAIGGAPLYAFCSGTSMASPHTSGAVVLLTQWWRANHAGATPSPAMAKALLVNQAVDMGTADIPNANEGWGRINITNVVNPPRPAEYWDQTVVFGNTGDGFGTSVGVVNPGQPVRVTLAWTDAAGAVGANPALVNNLDLTVTDGANVYKGNRFVSGTSATGGSYDTLNNVENVFLPSATGGGELLIDVVATAINGDGVPYNVDLTDQDWALVCSNCALTPDFTLAVTPPNVGICAPSDAGYTVNVGNILGFTDPVTLSASGNPGGTTVVFGTNPVTPVGSSTMTIGNTVAAAAGSYVIQVDGTSTTGTKSRNVGLDVFTATPSAVILLTPADGAVSQPVLPSFTWQAVTELGTYTIEVATDVGFGSIVASASGLTTPNWTSTTSLNTNTIYYWRVRASNTCGTGANSVVRSFSTVAAPGDCGIGTTLTPLFSESFDSTVVGWTHSGTGDSWAISGTRNHSAPSSFHANDPAVVSDQYLVSPAVALPAGASSVAMKFWNHQTIEHRAAGGCWDGAVVEISTNGGSSWTRLEAELLTDPYDGLIPSGFSNPLIGSNVWCGDPQDWMNSVVDISAFGGQTAQFRFRLASDSSVSREGWYIDDVSVHACTALLFNNGFETGTLTPWTGGWAPP